MHLVLYRKAETLQQEAALEWHPNKQQLYTDKCAT